MTEDFSRRTPSRTEIDLAITWRSYLPEHVLRLLTESARIGELPVTQRCEAIVLYADVVSFTAMAETLAERGSYGPEQLPGVITRWFAAPADAIARSGGSVVDFAGDALVGMFDITADSYPAV